VHDWSDDSVKYVEKMFHYLLYRWEPRMSVTVIQKSLVDLRVMWY